MFVTRFSEGLEVICRPAISEFREGDIMKNLGFAGVVCAILFFLATCDIASQAQTFSTITNLSSYDSQPNLEYLIQGTDGNLYGTTNGGGLGKDAGTVFFADLQGNVSTIMDFCSYPQNPGCNYGYMPSSGVIQGTDGDLYGVTYQAGGLYQLVPCCNRSTLNNIHCSVYVCLNVLYDTYFAFGVPVEDGSNLFGTASYGGTGGFCSIGNGCGTIYRVSSNGKEITTLYDFCSEPGCADGSFPSSSLVLAADGRFYGITYSGGVTGNGTIFKIRSSGSFTLLHTLANAEGSGAYGRLIQGTDGNFYGATPTGGANGSGTVFKMTPKGTVTVLYNFCAQPNCADGNGSYYGLVQGNDGNLYGTTGGGGAYGGGTVFQITPEGTYTVVHNFAGTDGSGPNGLMQHTNGTFYGTTYSGGANLCGTSDCGTIFSLSMGLGPFIETLPARGGAGRHVTILGSNLEGATSVSFNGTPAAFEVVSATEITTVVPAGAETGAVQVITPSGMLFSNSAFVVVQ
jgi:uncharacterized repeat protein (TIGR03803 family)